MFTKSTASLGALALTMFVAPAPAWAVDPHCAFPQPKGAKQVQVDLIPAFVACGGGSTCFGALAANTPDRTTESGAPACAPETCVTKAGEASNGWRWGAGAKGSVTLKALRHPPYEYYQNPTGNTVDVQIKLKLQGITSFDSLRGVDGTGTLALVTRSTVDDRDGGDMTAADAQTNLRFMLVGGRVKVRTTLDVLLNTANEPGLAPCQNFAVVSLAVLDENDTAFAEMGLFLPDL